MFEDIRPSNVLYFFQEPQIFVSSNDGMPVLCLKVDELEEGNSYLVVPTSDSLVENLVKGKSSLLAAFHQPWCWIVDAISFKITARVVSYIDEISLDYLPEPGVGLYHCHGLIRDSLYMRYSAAPFMSVKFEGEDLKEGIIGFSIFARLIADTYGSLRRVFLPVVNSLTNSVLSENALGRILQMPMRQTPRLASLSVEIERPEVETTTLRKKVVIDRDAEASSMQSASMSFLKEITEIDRIARKESIETQFQHGMSIALESLSQLVPTENGVFETVQIGATDLRGGSHTVQIGLSSGRRIAAAYKHLSRAPRTVKGKVVEINNRSGSFILRDVTGREVTCVVSSKAVHSAVTALMREADITVQGTYERRSRRDRLHADSVTLVDGTIITVQ